MVWLLRVKIKGEQGCGQKTSVMIEVLVKFRSGFFSGGNHITDHLAIYKLGGGCDQGSSEEADPIVVRSYTHTG